MNYEAVLSIMGVLIFIALIINAFFLRGIFSDLTTIKVSIGKIQTENIDHVRRIGSLETKVNI